MPHPQKIFVNKGVYFVTSSVEQGVLLPANPLMNMLITSCLAYAQQMHPVTISAFLVEGTHIHMILVVQNPNDVKHFMERFKTESAHLINRLLGRKKRTVWCKGSDSPILITPDDCLTKLAYLYCNPVKDGLVRSISEYPGASSYEALVYNQDEYKIETPRVHRPMVQQLPAKHLSENQYRNFAAEIKGKAKETRDLIIKPYAFMDAYGLNEEEKEKTKSKFLSELAATEADYQEARKDKGFVGAAKVAATDLDPDYVPERAGKRTLCICSVKEFRKNFLIWFRSLKNEAAKVLERWRNGELSAPYPIGLFPPAPPRVAELVARKVSVLALS